MRLRFLIPVLLSVLWPQMVSGVEQNTIWVMWERVNSPTLDCQGNACEARSEFRSHFVSDLPSSEAQALFNNWEPLARISGAANLTHERLPVCFEEPDPMLTQIDESGLEIAEKIDTLRGLEGIFADFRGARGPSWMRENFGEISDAFMRSALLNAGIPVLTREQLDVTPGRPQLTIRFSPEVQGCRPWSVSLSVKQTMVLTRDTSLMIEGTTWAASQRQSEEDVDFGPEEAMQTALLAFIEAFQQANAKPSEVAAQAQ